MLCLADTTPQTIQAILCPLSRSIGLNDTNSKTRRKNRRIDEGIPCQYWPTAVRRCLKYRKLSRIHNEQQLEISNHESTITQQTGTQAAKSSRQQKCCLPSHSCAIDATCLGIPTH